MEDLKTCSLEDLKMVKTWRLDLWLDWWLRHPGGLPPAFSPSCNAAPRTASAQDL